MQKVKVSSEGSWRKRTIFGCGSLLCIVFLAIVTLSIVLPLTIRGQKEQQTTTTEAPSGLQYNVIPTIIGRGIYDINNIELTQPPKVQLALQQVNGLSSRQCQASCTNVVECAFAVYDREATKVCTLFSYDATYFLVEDLTVNLLVRTNGLVYYYYYDIIYSYIINY
jgi:hypothetical protein